MPFASRSENAYLVAGLKIADEVDVLMAIWDGLQAVGRGGADRRGRGVLGEGRPLRAADSAGGFSTR
jgi:hypothetical protein